MSAHVGATVTSIQVAAGERLMTNRPAMLAPSDDFDPWPTTWAAIRRARAVEARIDPRTLSPAAQRYVPAHVEYLSATTVVVWHPLGNDHAVAVLTCIRLIRKGFTIVQRTP